MKKWLTVIIALMMMSVCLSAFADKATSSVVVNGYTLVSGQYLQNNTVSTGEPPEEIYPNVFAHFKDGVLKLYGVNYTQELGEDDTAVIYADGDLEIVESRNSGVYYTSSTSSADKHAAIYVTGDLKITSTQGLEAKYSGTEMDTGIYPKNAYGIYAGGNMEITGTGSVTAYGSPINSNGTITAGIMLAAI